MKLEFATINTVSKMENRLVYYNHKFHPTCEKKNKQHSMFLYYESFRFIRRLLTDLKAS